MSQVITDRALIDKFLTRGVEKILPDAEGLRAKLLSGERITAYIGMDPTGPNLHIGHAMGIRALRILQQLGHRVIFLVGDYTARVGDPDKATSRKLLTTEDIANNMEGWKQQAGKLIDFNDANNPVEWVHNFDWLSKLDFAQLIDLMSQFTVQQMLERDLFQKRIMANQPLQLQELIYPLMQGYDSVAMEVDLELGGTDQIFNMLTGRQLVDKYLHKSKWVRAHQMMPAPDGITMSKSKGNGINLNDSANDMYGKAMSYSDEHIVKGMELLTEMSKEEITAVAEAIKGGENPISYKKMLAFKIIETILGKTAAQGAQAHFEQTYQQRKVSSDRVQISLAKLNESLVRNQRVGDAVTIVAELAEISKTNARALIEQNGVQVELANGEMQKLTFGELYTPVVGQVLKVGKHKWFEFVN